MTAIEASDHRVRERIVALTRDLILIPGTANRADDRERCFQFVKNHLEALDGIRVREFRHAEIPSLTAVPDTAAPPDILLCAHVDVVDHPDLSAYRSRIENGRIHGAGAGDMKGILAILMEVFRSLHGRRPDASLGIVVTADEEMGGESGLGHLCAAGEIECREALIPDGGGLNEVTVEEKGILHALLRCRGEATHAARPWLGRNPVDPLLETLRGVQAKFDAWSAGVADHWHPTCAITALRTSTETRNCIPDEAHAILDIRFPAPRTAAEMIDETRECCAAGVELEPLVHAEPTHLAPDPLYAQMIEEVTGNPVRLVRNDGGSDARFLSARGIPVAMSRPLVGNLHSPDEWIDIDSMMTFHRILTRYLGGKLGIE